MPIPAAPARHETRRPVAVFAAVHLAVIVGALLLASTAMAPASATTDTGSMGFPAQMFLQLIITIPVLAWALSRDHWLAKKIAAVVAQVIFLLPAFLGLYVAGIVVCVLVPFPVADGFATTASLCVAATGTVVAFVWNRVVAHDAVMFVAITVFSAMLGLKLGVVPCMVFLGAMLVVDAVAVYFSKHMVVLAERSMERRLFPILIVPATLRALFDDARTTARDRDGGTAILGLGDLGIPTMLVVSAYTFLPGAGPYVGAVAGILAGYYVLSVMLERGSYHAGLPPLAGGALVGCLAGAVLTGVALF